MGITNVTSAKIRFRRNEISDEKDPERYGRQRAVNGPRTTVCLLRRFCRARREFTYHTSSVAGAVLLRFCSLLRSRVGQIAGSARLSSRDIENASCLFAVKCFKLTGNWRTIHHTAFETIAPLFFTKVVQTLSIQLHLGLGRVCQ